jgi:membrane associated rhomboid family serine protease
MPDTRPLRCPHCAANLIRQKTPAGFQYVCESCQGIAVNMPVLQNKQIAPDFIKSLWKSALNQNQERERRCPHCAKLMAEVTTSTPSGDVTLDICQPCQTVWFDTDELERLPRKPAPIQEKPLPEKARNAMLAADLEALKDDFDSRDHRPFTWRKTAGTILDFPAEDNDAPIPQPPYITWGLILLSLGMFILSLSDFSNVIGAFGFIPSQWSRMGGLTSITSFFIYNNIFQMIYSLYFLLIFGDNAETKLGKIRYLILVFVSHEIGNLLSYLIFPHSQLPVFGCGAAIAGVLAYYAVLFPDAKITILWLIRPRYYTYRYGNPRFNSPWIRFSALGYLIFFIIINLGHSFFYAGTIEMTIHVAQLGAAAFGFAWGLATPKSRREYRPPIEIK